MAVGAETSSTRCPNPECGRIAGASETQCAECAHDLESYRAVARELAPRLEMGHVLGAGGMGVVYSAVDRTTGERYAVKVLPAEFRDEIAIAERFRREIAMCQELRHPHIVRVLESGGARDRCPYFVMELVEGQSLDRLLDVASYEARAKVHLARRPPHADREAFLKRSGLLWVGDKYVKWLDIGSACTLLRDTAEALAFAHAKRVIHRDIKPSNVMVRPSGHAVVTDFGIAKSYVSTDVQLTSTEMSAPGTRIYMSPERFRPNDGAEADDALDTLRLAQCIDLYAFGVTAYETLTGLPPFVGNAMQIEYAHLTKKAKPLVEVRPDIPQGVSDLVDRLLKKDPAERFVTWGRIRDTLSQYARSESKGETPTPPRARPSSGGYRGSEPSGDAERAKAANDRLTGRGLTLAIEGVNSLAEGRATPLSCRMTDADGVVTGSAVSWSTSDARVATVESRDPGEENGVATALLLAVAPGVVTVSATALGKRAEWRVEIIERPMRLQLSEPRVRLEPEQRVRLTVQTVGTSGRRWTAGESATWRSSNPSVVTVGDDGTLVGVAEGECTISVRLYDLTDQCLVSVEDTSPRTLVIKVEPSAVAAGDFATLSAHLETRSGRKLEATYLHWLSLSPTVAIVDGNGRVKALSGGTAELLGISGSVTGSASLSVRGGGTLEPTSSVDLTTARRVSPSVAGPLLLVLVLPLVLGWLLAFS